MISDSSIEKVSRAVLVTGGSSGIGRGIAIALARNGARVVVTGRRAEVIDELVALNVGEISGVVSDMTLAEDRDRAVREAEERVGPIDILVNNVGGGPPRAFMDLTGEDWALAFQQNLTPTVELTRVLARGMIERGWGRVLNISSTVGREPDPMFAPYSAAKAAVINFTQSAAKALAPHGVMVNCILPGVVATEAVNRHAEESAQARGVDTEEIMRRMLKKFPIPAQRVGTVEDIASAAVFLVGEESSWISGVSLLVDGGTHNFAF